MFSRESVQKRAGRALRVSVACGLALALTGPVLAIGPSPTIGGVPSMTAGATFTGGSGSNAWLADVYSYAFIGSAVGDPIPSSVPSLPDPGDGQTLFMYVIRMSDDPVNYPASVNEFTVGNPIPAMVPTVGYDPTLVPNEGMPGEYEGNRQVPNAVFSSLDARSISYFFDNAFTLDPSSAPQGEFTVLYFLAEYMPGLVPSTMVGGAASFDEHLILGPIPEPSTVSLLAAGLAVLALSRRRRQA